MDFSTIEDPPPLKRKMTSEAAVCACSNFSIALAA